MHVVCYFYINVKLTHNSESKLHQSQTQLTQSQTAYKLLGLLTV